MHKITADWSAKISNPVQLGGIETSVLDNGPGRGSRIAWVNTGSGLWYKVLLDRGMDIGEVVFNGYSMAWISQLGYVGPNAVPYRDDDWLKSFGGGLLTTCGLDHIGGSESDEFGIRCMHGPISGQPAFVGSILQPDPFSGRMGMHVEGVVKQSQPLGIQLELKRTITSKLGEPVIYLHDEVTNRGNTAAPHMLLYHMNLGWPLLDEDAAICWKGKWQSREGTGRAQIFRPGAAFHKGKPPIEQHAGGGEEAAFIAISADEDGRCLCGIHNPKIGLALSIAFRKNQLPWLTNWQHWGAGEYVMGLEPGTHPPVGQSKARDEGTLIMLQPNEKRIYDLEIRLLDSPEAISDFVNLAGTGINSINQ